MPSPNEEHVFYIERWLMRNQAVITLFLIGIFFLLVIVSLAVDAPQVKNTVNTFLPIISGWIGVVIGFFFSREISKYFEDRLNSFKSDLKDYDKQLGQALQERDEEITNLKEEFKHILEEKDRQYRRLRDYLSNRIEHRQSSGNQIIKERMMRDMERRERRMGDEK